MDIPLEIAFHNIEPTAAMESLIREHVERLEKLYPHLVGCRVSVEMPHKQHRSGNVPEVHIAMRVPGREIAVSREPHKPALRHAAPNVHTSIKEAFRAAEKRLTDFKQQQYGEVKAKEMLVHGALQQPVQQSQSRQIDSGRGMD